MCADAFENLLQETSQKKESKAVNDASENGHKTDFKIILKTLIHSQPQKRFASSQFIFSREVALSFDIMYCCSFFEGWFFCRKMWKCSHSNMKSVISTFQFFHSSIFTTVSVFPSRWRIQSKVFFHCVKWNHHQKKFYGLHQHFLRTKCKCVVDVPKNFLEWKKFRKFSLKWNSLLLLIQCNFVIYLARCSVKVFRMKWMKDVYMYLKKIHSRNV